jgi:hypothetical protein
MNKTVKLTDFLTDAQLKECIKLFPDREAMLAKVIEPNMVEINRKLGQENDARYLSLMVYFLLDLTLERVS